MRVHTTVRTTRLFAVDATNMILKEMKKRADATETSPVSVHTLRDPLGRTPLHVAVELGTLQCGATLIRSCKSKDAARKLINATNNSGQTVLHVAMERMDSLDSSKIESLVKTLLKASLAAGDAETTKTFVNAKDLRGVTAYEIGVVKNFTKLNMLNEYVEDKKSDVPKPAIGTGRAENDTTCVFTHPICT